MSQRSVKPCSISSTCSIDWSASGSQVARDSVCQSSSAVWPCGTVLYSYVYVNKRRSAEAVEDDRTTVTSEQTKTTAKRLIFEIENSFQFRPIQAASADFS